MSTPLFIHGWGLDGGLWRAVLAGLGDRPAAIADLGFHGRRSLPAVERPVVIGHSMGFAWALANVPRPWAAAVAINAFPRFVADADFPGVPSRNLALMRRQFAEDPAAVTAVFLERCGIAAADVSNIDAQVLGDSLDWLTRCDLRAALAGIDCPLVALAGGRDAVVPEAMSRAGFAAHSLEIIADGGHLLPLSHPESVVAAINTVAP